MPKGREICARPNFRGSHAWAESEAALVEMRLAVHVKPPVVRGTRLAVDFLLELFAKGWTLEEVLNAYPQLTPEALQAVFAFAAEVLHDDRVYAPRRAVG